MRVNILGKQWTICFENIRACRGMCDPPGTPKKRITISNKLKGEEKLEVIIHECLHAAGWHLDETFVEEFSQQLSRIITRAGYTETKESP